MDGLMRTIDIIKSLLETHSPAALELSSWQDMRGVWDNPREWHLLQVTTPEETVEKIKNLFRKVQEKNPPWDLGLCSNVAMTFGRVLHIPHIDFRAKVPENGQAICKEKILSVIAKNPKALPGWLLCSGQSYHYIGAKLFTLDEWLDFMGLCLLCEDGKDPNRFSPVDRLWVGHCLRRKKTVLRIFERPNRPEPYVVEYIAAP